MKGSLLLSTILLLASVAVGSDTQTLTSSDGSKSLEAKIENYDPACLCIQRRRSAEVQSMV
jgi:hypothetical protein